MSWRRMPRLGSTVVALFCVCFVSGRCVERAAAAAGPVIRTVAAPSGRAAMLVISKETMTLTVLDADSAA
ncbi:MAG: hypothetical protein LBU98_03720, partial [Alistipes sp.]|nr:hypothetical protein [Alistipes sp.]